MIKLSYNEALNIQWSQIAYYRRLLKRNGVKQLRKITKNALKI